MSMAAKGYENFTPDASATAAKFSLSKEARAGAEMSKGLLGKS
jgi:hypothetical protein